MKPTHPLQPEDVMAYLDGETTPAEARDIGAHLAGCESCQRLAADLRDRSTRLQAWQIGDPPASLVAPKSHSADPRRSIRMASGRLWSVLAARPWLSAAAVVVVIAAGALIQPNPKVKLDASAVASSAAPLSYAEHLSREMPETLGASRPADSISRFSTQKAAQSNQGTAAPQTLDAGPRIVRTATLRIVATDFDRIRPAIDRILQNVGGFVGDVTASDRPGSVRSIRGTLRIPGAQFSTALAQLRALGRVTEDAQNAEDVTATVVDLDVRLANGRATEKRLNQVLQNRTGSVADVLEVEREIARVRMEIERLEAQRTQLDRRIEYGTVTLEVLEERAAGVALGPVPIPTRIRHAIADGVESAAMSMLDATLFVLRAGPVLLLWMTVLGLPAWLIFRRHAVRPGQRPGGV
jgi:uncharacterized small protein (DUF1192 family)